MLQCKQIIVCSRHENNQNMSIERLLLEQDEVSVVQLFLADDSGRMFSGSNIELFTNA